MWCFLSVGFEVVERRRESLIGLFCVDNDDDDESERGC